ncbi:hypothetical protein BDZ97DRAFT_1756798 [Flammula alnicola]|nr:hypothetical protein BDZ97DRAFT_1756798 [Flammula alnicola]
MQAFRMQSAAFTAKWAKEFNANDKRLAEICSNKEESELPAVSRVPENPKATGSSLRSPRKRESNSDSDLPSSNPSSASKRRRVVEKDAAPSASPEPARRSAPNLSSTNTAAPNPRKRRAEVVPTHHKPLKWYPEPPSGRGLQRTHSFVQVDHGSHVYWHHAGEGRIILRAQVDAADAALQNNATSTTAMPASSTPANDARCQLVPWWRWRSKGKCWSSSKKRTRDAEEDEDEDPRPATKKRSPDAKSMLPPPRPVASRSALGALASSRAPRAASSNSSPSSSGIIPAPGSPSPIRRSVRLTKEKAAKSPRTNEVSSRARFTHLVLIPSRQPFVTRTPCKGKGGQVPQA